jgi:hypothetical protein
VTVVDDGASKSALSSVGAGHSVIHAEVIDWLEGANRAKSTVTGRPTSESSEHHDKLELPPVLGTGQLTPGHGHPCQEGNRLSIPRLRKVTRTETHPNICPPASLTISCMPV